MLSRQRPYPSMLIATPGSLEYFDETVGSELAPLIGVEDCWNSVGLHGVLQSLDAEVGIHRQRYPPAQDLPAA